MILNALHHGLRTRGAAIIRGVPVVLALLSILHAETAVGQEVSRGSLESNVNAATGGSSGTLELADFDVSLDGDDDLGGLDSTGLDLATESELLLFEEIPVVISASRRAQPVTMSSIPISVVTAEDIHYGGFTNVGEMLQFVPGVDIQQRDRNSLAVGVRGLFHQYSDRVLVLIDGRDASSPIFGGADYYQFPMIPEDIKQIEVVRGPRGAAWGANAFHGVINIITKEPDELPRFLASTTINEFGDTLSFGRWAHTDGDWSWRVSGGYEERESSEDANINDSFESRDYHRDHRIDAELVKRLPGGKLSFGASHIHIDRGDAEVIGYPGRPTDPRRDERIDAARLFARLDVEADHDTEWYVQWFGNYEDVYRHSLWDYRSYENDI